MVCFSSLRSTYKDSILHYKAVKVTINVPDVAEVILNIVVCHHGLPGLVVINSGALYPLGTCHCCAMFYALDAVFLLRLICKHAALPKSQIAASKAYLLSASLFPSRDYIAECIAYCPDSHLIKKSCLHTFSRIAPRLHNLDTWPSSIHAEHPSLVQPNAIFYRLTILQLYL